MTKRKKEEEALALLEKLRIQVKPTIRAILKLNDISYELQWLETQSLLLDDDRNQHRRIGNLRTSVIQIREDFYRKLVNDVSSLVLQREDGKN